MSFFEGTTLPELIEALLDLEEFRGSSRLDWFQFKSILHKKTPSEFLRTEKLGGLLRQDLDRRVLEELKKQYGFVDTEKKVLIRLYDLNTPTLEIYAQAMVKINKGIDDFRKARRELEARQSLGDTSIEPLIKRIENAIEVATKVA